ncbi:MAG: hypothetical protein V4606_04680 [Patescibacteria group bacterium]
MENNTTHTWNEYVATQLKYVTDTLLPLGYTLDTTQPHLLGERFLMQAVTTTGGRKLILQGKNQDNQKVIIKVASDTQGKDEIKHERLCRSLINSLNFAYGVFTAPQELLFIEKDGRVIAIQEFIEQTSTFLERPLLEQFDFALHSLKAQAQAQITTRGHFRSISNTFGYYEVADYFKNADLFIDTISSMFSDQTILNTLTTARNYLHEHKERIAQYTGFLTHTDFVPHNFRIRDNTVYLLDFSSIRFGNKHESWARFLNFMTLYNHPLEQAVLKYADQNFSPEERESLQLMRVYRLLEIIAYYCTTTKNSTGDLLTLNQNRISFWHEVLMAELQNHRVERAVVSAYQSTRDELRSQGEKERQKGLH